jgi:hypothetical protein
MDEDGYKQFINKTAIFLTGKEKIPLRFHELKILDELEIAREKICNNSDKKFKKPEKYFILNEQLPKGDYFVEIIADDSLTLSGNDYFVTCDA